MPGRWRGRLAGLAILALPLISCAVAARDATVVVIGPGGDVLARAPARDGTFALRYRNSLYGSPAEERYEVDTDGRMVLTGLWADELAVLEEYYAIDQAAARTDDGWSAPPARRDIVLDTLTVAATDLGERTLLVDGHAPIPLWELVSDDDPMVRLEISP
jgi:hypothetical protein